MFSKCLSLSFYLFALGSAVEILKEWNVTGKKKVDMRNPASWVSVNCYIYMNFWKYFKQNAFLKIRCFYFGFMLKFTLPACTESVQVTALIRTEITNKENLNKGVWHWYLHVQPKKKKKPKPQPEASAEPAPPEAATPEEAKDETNGFHTNGSVMDGESLDSLSEQLDSASLDASELDSEPATSETTGKHGSRSCLILLLASF